ncbi:TetR family transcriptional regulator [Nesterenkonia sp. CL21]|uniref:TetR family transcriptional regulator n=1 Tax=Nesterenkonia sp. CL21 TaxID=3064894 RepID=UPI002879B9F6|nr:TetR family transcriptional regulator [Nesterenkonia sp. CL21]MDS2172830.1 TetR family transcriptional regulator [Nesterenkonia sp. CL21]
MSQRERNRIDTWNAVHEAAQAVAWDEGPQAATVERIAASAGVSRRTFFNYFPTKEDAILGTRAPEVTEEAIRRFRGSEADELTRVVHLFVAVVRTAIPESTSAQRRRIIAEHPGLQKRVALLLSEVERLVAEVIQARVDDGEDVALAQPDDDQRLEALLMLAGVIAKYAFHRYQDSSSAEDPRHFLEESIAMFREVVDTTR